MLSKFLEGRLTLGRGERGWIAQIYPVKGVTLTEEELDSILKRYKLSHLVTKLEYAPKRKPQTNFERILDGDSTVYPDKWILYFNETVNEFDWEIYDNLIALTSGMPC